MHFFSLVILYPVLCVVQLTTYLLVLHFLHIIFSAVQHTIHSRINNAKIQHVNIALHAIKQETLAHSLVFEVILWIFMTSLPVRDSEAEVT